MALIDHRGSSAQFQDTQVTSLETQGDVTDDQGNTIYDYSAQEVPNAVVEALANLAADEAFDAYPIVAADIETDAVGTAEIDRSVGYTWTGTHDFTGGGLQLPSATAPTPTTEAEVAWDSDDDKLRVGDGAATVTPVNESRSLTGGNAIDAIGDLSADRTVAVSTDGIGTDELDLSIAPTWTSEHTFGTGFTLADSNREALSGDKTISAGGPTIQNLDPNGSARTVTLPAESDGEWFVIGCRGSASNNLTVNDDGGGTIATVTPGDVGHFWSDGTGWLGAVASGGVT